MEETEFIKIIELITQRTGIIPLESHKLGIKNYIKSQINRVNETLLKESMSYDAFVSLNDVYRAIGLPDMGAGEDRVWRINKEGIIELKPYSILVDGDRPCWVLAFAKAPSVVQPWEMDRM